MSRSYVDALEGQVASLQLFITNLAAASPLERDQMLANFQRPSEADHLPQLTTDVSQTRIQGRSRGRLLRKKDGVAAQFYGETSFYPIVPSVDEAELDEDLRPSPDILTAHSSAVARVESQQLPLQTSTIEQHGLGCPTHGDTDATLTPQSPICKQLMSAFFQHFYYYHMVLYREYFLRDYKSGSGKYYSDLLFYALVSMGALASDDPAIRALSDVFYNRADKLLHSGVLHSPNVTTIQALVILGQRDIGCGRNTQGWLLTGLAFRLIHEMGFHLDPDHWKTSHDSEVGSEVLRRLYWGCFIADKQLSLYLGRPPALHLNAADVRDSVRIAYPVDWDVLLNDYVKSNTSRTEYEDGVAFTSCFAQMSNLSKIAHRMLTEVFENRKNTTDSTVLTASTKSIHVALTKWLTDLPAKLHWNQWQKGSVPSYVLHLHAYYHTLLILLFRPPRRIISTQFAAFRGGFEICEQSLDSILLLLKAYSRDHGFDHLPVTFIHTAATATSIILLKLHVQRSSNSLNEATYQLEQISIAVDKLSKTWPAAIPVQTAVNEAKQQVSHANSFEVPIAFDWDNPMDNPIRFDWQLGPSVQTDENFPQPDSDAANILWTPAILDDAEMGQSYEQSNDSAVNLN